MIYAGISRYNGTVELAFSQTGCSMFIVKCAGAARRRKWIEDNWALLLPWSGAGVGVGVLSGAGDSLT